MHSTVRCLPAVGSVSILVHQIHPQTGPLLRLGGIFRCGSAAHCLPMLPSKKSTQVLRKQSWVWPRGVIAQPVMEEGEQWCHIYPVYASAGIIAAWTWRQGQNLRSCFAESCRGVWKTCSWIKQWFANENMLTKWPTGHAGSLLSVVLHTEGSKLRLFQDTAAPAVLY